MYLKLYLFLLLNQLFLVNCAQKCLKHPKSSIPLSVDKLKSIISPCGVEKLDALGENIKCEQAHPQIINSLAKYKLDESPCAVAMYLSTLMLESGNLTYNRNHYPPPGIVGMGTRFMLNPYNLYIFVKSNPDLFTKYQEIYKLTDYPYDENNNFSKKLILDLLMKDEFSFLPGAWWIARGAEIIMGCTIKLSTCPPDGQVDMYIKKCLGVIASDGRMRAYQAVINQIRVQESQGSIKSLD
jgi:hypothetical protein